MALYLLIVGATACTSDVIESSQENNSFRIQSTIQSITRAPQLDAQGAGKFIDGDQNSLFFQAPQLVEPIKQLYTYGKSHYWIDLGIPYQTEDLRVSACYPPVQSSKPSHHQWEAQGELAGQDLLLARPVEVTWGSTEPVVLNFSHALHKLEVKLESAHEEVTSEMLKQATLSCRQFKSVATLNLLEGTVVDATGSMGSFSQQGDQASFLLPPQAVGVIEVVVQIGQRSFVQLLSACQVQGCPLAQLESGKIFSLTLRVSKESFFIAGQTISGWGTQGETEDSITL